FPKHEQMYFTWHLMSSETKSTQHVASQPTSTLTDEIVEELVMRMQFLTMTGFKQDPDLMGGLSVHLHAVIHRISYGFVITNPLLDNIKKMYPYMFSMIVFALEDINAKFNMTIPEDEAAYLVLHFQASMERLQKKSNTTDQILIVCHMGVGMSRLLQVKLEQQYKGIQIMDCIGKMELPTFLKTHTPDLIVSTVELDHIDIPYVKISPLLEARDKA